MFLGQGLHHVADEFGCGVKKCFVCFDEMFARLSWATVALAGALILDLDFSGRNAGPIIFDRGLSGHSQASACLDLGLYSFRSFQVTCLSVGGGHSSSNEQTG